MPSGKTHDLITFTTLPVVCLGGIWVTQESTSTLILAGSYVFAASMFSGDLDLNSRQTKRWGPLSILWKPYQKFGHRSIWTHGVFVGTAIRLLYVLAWATILVFLLSMIPSITYDVTNMYQDLFGLIQRYPDETSLVLAGLLLGAFSHTFADITVSFMKKKLKNYGIMKSRRK